MNVIFISPHFPLHFYNFCSNLKNLGANVLGIGDSPYNSLTRECKNSLREYYFLPDLENYDGVYRAVAFFSFKYGKIDYIESQNEYWLEFEAKLRDDFNISSGFRTADMAAIKNKSLMKNGYRRAKVRTARYILVEDYAPSYDKIIINNYPKSDFFFASRFNHKKL